MDKWRSADFSIQTWYIPLEAKVANFAEYVRTLDSHKINGILKMKILELVFQGRHGGHGGGIGAALGQFAGALFNEIGSGHHQHPPHKHAPPVCEVLKQATHIYPPFLT